MPWAGAYGIGIVTEWTGPLRGTVNLRAILSQFTEHTAGIEGKIQAMTEGIQLRPLEMTEWDQIQKALGRAGAGPILPSMIRIGFGRAGRFTLCLLEHTQERDERPDEPVRFGLPVKKTACFWGACRIDPNDEDCQENANRIALRKACLQLVGALQAEEAERLWQKINCVRDQIEKSTAKGMKDPRVQATIERAVKDMPELVPYPCRHVRPAPVFID